jgi:hypothetical protein
MTLLDIVGTGVVAGLGAYLGAYLRKKGENLATHEDIDKLVSQVTAVTTAAKRIESAISTEVWRRERKAELQLKTADAINTLTSDYIQNVIADPKYKPSVAWFSSFSATDAVVKALFAERTYQEFKKLEVRIGPGLGSQSGPTTAIWEFVDARDRAVKEMYDEVVGREMGFNSSP